MTRKEPADHVFFNVRFLHSDAEAIAIYQNKVVGIGSIPEIFSNYRGFKDYNAQGFLIGQQNETKISVGQVANGISIYKDVFHEKNILWEIKAGDCIAKHTEHLDPHWDDH